MNQDDLGLELDKDLENELLKEVLEDEVNKNTLTNESLNGDTKKEPPKKRRRRKFSKKALKENLRIRSVLLLLVTLIANTYAWFVYCSTVSANIDVHIKSWNFELSSGEKDTPFDFTVDEIYPGMDEVDKTITANNSGEADASLKLTIKYMRILDDVYYTEDYDGTIPEGQPTYTTQQLLSFIMGPNRIYPFNINMYLNGTLYDGSDTVMKTGDTTDIKYEITWDYELQDYDNLDASGNPQTPTKAQSKARDTLDTEYGNKAYDYYIAHKDDKDESGNPAISSKYCIVISTKIEAVEDLGTSSSTSTTP